MPALPVEPAVHAAPAVPAQPAAPAHPGPLHHEVIDFVSGMSGEHHNLAVWPASVDVMIPRISPTSRALVSDKDLRGCNLCLTHLSVRRCSNCLHHDWL